MPNKTVHGRRRLHRGDLEFQTRRGLTEEDAGGRKHAKAKTNAKTCAKNSYPHLLSKPWPSYFFSPACQFSTTVIGSAAPSPELVAIRKRLPSAVTS